MKLDTLRSVALEAAEKAGKKLMKYFGKPLDVREKEGDAGLVTSADLDAEQVAIKTLKAKTPHFDFLTEESAPEIRPSSAEGRWIIDPLDGTTNFVHRFPMFCVSIAAEWRGELVVGVIHHPVLKETYLAVRGQGAWLNGKAIHVSRSRSLHTALLSTGFSYHKNEWLQAEMKAFETLSRQARAIRRPGSAALDLAYTARGVFDGFWERGLSPWDIAAGSLLIQEAGGKVTDFKGIPHTFQTPEILATNTLLHRLLLQELQSSLSKSL